MKAKGNNHLLGLDYTDWLVRFMHKKYPNKGFKAVPKEELGMTELHADSPKVLICFVQDYVCITDPKLSMCMRFATDPTAEYGIEHLDASTIHKHNYPPKVIPPERVAETAKRLGVSISEVRRRRKANEGN